MIRLAGFCAAASVVFCLILGVVVFSRPVLYERLFRTGEKACTDAEYTSVRDSRFAICKAWVTQDGEYVHAYIYDETDEVGLPEWRRSSNWKSSVKAYARKFPYSMFAKMDGKAVKIADHIYIFNFDYYEIPSADRGL
jgi:hypothetical protein